MRKLFFVPIIHSPADMGTIGSVLSETSASVLGKELWAEHQKTIALFWDSIARFFLSEAVKVTKIYQDGLLAAGEDGLKIIHEGVRQGSVNYEIIAGLLRRGAILVKTEDRALVQREYNYIRKITSAKSPRERETFASRYKLAQQKLLADRDKHIARTIDSTLKEGDTGVLFIGAYHEVLAKLPANIQVVQVKEAAKVREYHRVLSNINDKTQGRYQQLAEYVGSPASDTGTD